MVAAGSPRREAVLSRRPQDLSTGCHGIVVMPLTVRDACRASGEVTLILTGHGSEQVGSGMSEGHGREAAAKRSSPEPSDCTEVRKHLAVLAADGHQAVLCIDQPEPSHPAPRLGSLLPLPAHTGCSISPIPVTFVTLGSPLPDEQRQQRRSPPRGTRCLTDMPMRALPG